MRKLMMTLLIPAAVFFSSSVFSNQEMVIEKASPLGFDATIEKLVSNAKSLGWKVPKKWKKNFRKNLKHVTKKDIGKATVVEMCEPHAAVDLLQHDQYKKFLSMMPCSIAVYEKSDGKVYMSMMNIQMMGQVYKGEKAIDDLITKLGPHMDKMLDVK